MKTPILLFVYNRLKHTQDTINSLLCNHGAENHDLIIYSDGYKTEDDKASVDEVRKYISTIKGFRSQRLNLRSCNYGLSKSLVSGVTESLTDYEQVIVLEDDLLTSPHFLQYMNDALGRFKADDRVACIHGYLYPVEALLPEAFFLRGGDCWGWATWRRGWNIYNADARYLLDNITQKSLSKHFDYDGSYPYTKMLSDRVRRINDSWAILWHASLYLSEKLTLYPGRSLIYNSGHDNSGVNCKESRLFNTELSSRPIDLTDLNICESETGRVEITKYFRNSRSLKARILNRFSNISL